jgi:hypothetical protein
MIARKIVWLVIAGAFFMSPFPGVWAKTLETTPDVGLVMLVSGDVTYENVGCPKPEKLLAFMKLRRDDRIKLGQGAKMIVLYTASGRRETWLGPAAVTIGQTETPASEQSPASVETLPGHVSDSLKNSVMPVECFGGRRWGGTPVRAKGGMGLTDPRVREEEITAARNEYEKLKKQSPPGDLMPELYLLARLASFRRYSEAAAIVDQMAAAAPENPVLKQWKNWLADIQGAFPVRLFIVHLSLDPDCRGGMECVDMGPLGVFRSQGVFMSEELAGKTFASGDLLKFFLDNDSDRDHYIRLLDIPDGQTPLWIYPDPNAAADQGMIQAGLQKDLYQEAGAGLILEKSGREIVRLVVSDTPIKPGAETGKKYVDVELIIK